MIRYTQIMLKHKKGPSPSKYLRSFADARIVSFESLVGPAALWRAVLWWHVCGR